MSPAAPTRILLSRTQIATHDPRLRVFGTRRLWMEDGCLAPVVNRTD